MYIMITSYRPERLVLCPDNETSHFHSLFRVIQFVIIVPLKGDSYDGSPEAIWMMPFKDDMKTLNVVIVT